MNMINLERFYLEKLTQKRKKIVINKKIVILNCILLKYICCKLKGTIMIFKLCKKTTGFRMCITILSRMSFNHPIIITFKIKFMLDIV